MLQTQPIPDSAPITNSHVMYWPTLGQYHVCIMSSVALGGHKPGAKYAVLTFRFSRSPVFYSYDSAMPDTLWTSWCNWGVFRERSIWQRMYLPVDGERPLTEGSLRYSTPFYLWLEI